MNTSADMAPRANPEISQEALKQMRSLSRRADDVKRAFENLSIDRDSLSCDNAKDTAMLENMSLRSWEDDAVAKAVSVLEAECDILGEFMDRFCEFSEAVERERERSEKSARLDKAIAALSLSVATVSLLGQFGFFSWLLSSISA